MGATSGLGRGVALGLLAEGYIIGVCGRRKEALDEIKAIAPDKVFTKVIDVTKEEAPSLLMELIMLLLIGLVCPPCLIEDGFQTFAVCFLSDQQRIELDGLLTDLLE